MAEKLPPKKRLSFRLTNTNPSAGTSAGGGGGDGAAPPASAPPRTSSSSPPRSPSPPEPFTYNDSAAGISGDGGGAAAAAVPGPAPRRETSSSPSRSPSPPEPFTYNDPGAGISGFGGGAAAVPPPAPRRTPSSSPPRSPSPPKPFTYDPSAGSKPSSSPPRSPLPPKLSAYNSSAAGSSGGGGGGGAAGPTDTKDSDGGKPDEFKTENGWGSLFMSDPEVHSSDPQNLPHYIGRQDCDPLSRQEFFSLRHNWQQLLDGKKTYLRRAADSNYADSVFVTPKPLEKPLRCQEPLSHLVRGGAGKPITQQKFKILSEHYVRFRPFRSDGSQFYRAFLFSYLENLGKMQGSQAEVTRLMECVKRSRVNFRRLKWNNAYFSNPEAFFSSVVSEFEHLVNSAANGLNAAELYKISLHEISSSRILSLLRLLTEVHIRTYEADYNRVIANPKENEKINALVFCKESVRPFGADAALLQMKALSQALGIPLHLAAVDGVKIGETVQVKCIDIIPRSGGPLSSTRRYYLSSATDKQPFLPPGNLFLSDRMPLVTILITPSATAILYRK